MELEGELLKIYFPNKSQELLTGPIDLKSFSGRTILFLTPTNSSFNVIG
jgi:hypothetical protein